jgi:hypothetical protein
MAAKRNGPKKETNPTPLDRSLREIAEKQAKIRADAERLEKVIQDAPRKKAENNRLRQEEYIKRKEKTSASGFGRRPAKIQDPRFPYELNVTTAAQQKTLRKERNKGMMTFFLLCLVLAGVLWWLYVTVLQGL